MVPVLGKRQTTKARDRPCVNKKTTPVASVLVTSSFEDLTAIVLENTLALNGQ